MQTLDIARLAGDHLDLVSAPFTLPRSRLLVFRSDRADWVAAGGAEGAAPATAIRVHTSEYEYRLSESCAIESLVVRDAAGDALPVTDVLPHRIEFGGGAATLGFADVRTLSIGGDKPGLTVDWEAPDRGRSHAAVTDAGVRLHVASDRTVTVAPATGHAAALERTRGLWDEWFAKCPVVRDDLQAMTAFCWWVLGANIIELSALGDARAVVPSKIGYVGVWQWDAYFIAMGLRHGDPELAREQLEIMFRFPSENGQLPDVVHEQGVLASTDDLPPNDRSRKRLPGSDEPIPVTKPPLAAWALGKVLEAEDAPEWAREQLARIRRSQDWWFAGSDLDGDGMPEYGHAYSSGLDDNPIFDAPQPTAAPDLGAYLVLQDRELARLAERYGADAAGDPAAHRERAARTRELLIGMWSEEAGCFHARGAGEELSSDTIVGFMPLLTGDLPEHITESLVAALADPARYALEWSVPTVSAADADFSDERMWRGPVWINTNRLIVEGLLASGRPELARELAERTVRLVIHGGGPHEYFNPRTGRKARTATTAFGWSAALFVDLAVWLS